MSKLIKKQPDGKFKVNKAAVLDRLRKNLKKAKEAPKIDGLPGLLPVSQREIEEEFAAMTLGHADSFRQKDFS